MENNDNLQIGAVNPYALAEVVLKKKINWKSIKNQEEFLEKVLQHPYAKLFDPVYDSPLFPSLKVNPKTKVVEKATKSVTKTALADVGAGAVWADPGEFFDEAAEMNDPVQGAVANCYFIAALSSVSWARTYQIAQRSRAVGNAPQSFVDMIEFYKNGASQKVEVSELLPLTAPGNFFIYARSSEVGEIWPAVYEKAFAKWKTGTNSDQPDILATAFGDPVGAAALLTNLTPSYYNNTLMTADDIWQTIRGNCLSYKTFNPIVAWTYGTAPAGISYNNAHIVANHAYSVLGWYFISNQKYIVLRNPWGGYEGTLNIFNGNWPAWDAPYYGGPGWWRTANMSALDGIFCMRADTFKSHFAGFGVVK